MATQNARQDQNRFPTLIGVGGTAGTADASGTADIVQVGVNPSTGALYVQDLSGASGTTNVQIVGGTFNAGTITGGTIEAGTITNLIQQESGTYSNNTVVVAGQTPVTNVVQSLRSNANTAGLNIDGDVAHDGLDIGNPVKIGGQGNDTAPANVSANGDRVNAWFLRNGAQVVSMTNGTITGGTLTNLVSGTVNALASGTITSGTVSAMAISTGTLGTVGTVADAGTAPLRVDSNNALWMNLGYKLDGTNDSITVMQGTLNALASGTVTAGTLQLGYPSFSYISAAGTTTIKSGTGVLNTITVGSLLGGGTLYNSAGTSASVIWSVITPTPQTFHFNLAFGSLTWAGTGAQNINIVYA